MSDERRIRRAEWLGFWSGLCWLGLGAGVMVLFSGSWWALAAVALFAAALYWIGLCLGRLHREGRR